MNPKLLMLSATLAATATMTHGFFNPVISGLAVQLPLLSTAGIAGGVAMPLAVLGVIKLAAAAAIAAGALGTAGLGASLPSVPGVELPAVPGLPADEGYAYSRHYHRQRRSAEQMAATDDAVFGIVSSMDMYSCGKALVCGLKAKDEAQLANDEVLILSLFADRKARKTVNPASPKAEYDLAAELGLATHDEVACRKRYATCPYTTEEMMTSLRQSNL